MAEEKMIRVRLLRARWDEKGERIEAGTETMLTASAAVEAVEAGLVESVKEPKKA